MNTKFDADSLLYSLILNVTATQYTCSFNSACHPHRLVQWSESSLFTQAHSSPPSLIARLHRCHPNHFHYINNGWTFSRQTLYILQKVELNSDYGNKIKDENLLLSTVNF